MEAKFCDAENEQLSETEVAAERSKQAAAARSRHEGYQAESLRDEQSRKKTGDALAQERAQSDSDVRDATAAREESEREKMLRARAEEAVRSRDRFVAVVSHDLRNPLNVISMSATQLLRNLPRTESGARFHAWSAAIERSVHRMNALIGDLLDLASIDAGRFGIRAAKYEVCQLADEAAEMMRPLASEKNIELRKATPEQLAQVHCDRERILQVFSNLIGNAIKFCPEQSTITISVALDGDRVRLCVADDGPGIAVDQAAHVFDRYRQAERTPKKGLGLGLSITKGIVEAHGGRVWVESERGHGAKFFFTLPKAAA